MAKVRIVTDVAAYLKPDVISRHRITVLPMEIRFGDEKYIISPGDDRMPRLLFEQMSNGAAKPAHAVFSSSAFIEAFERLSREAEDVLLILSSGKLSNSVARAQTVARAYMGRCRITIMDSLSSSWGLGLLVEAAAKAAEEGMPIDGIVRLVRGMLPHIYIVFMLERLDYLEQGGRIGVAQALLGTMLRIKPLLLIEDGEVVPMEKVRTRTLALEKLASFVGEFATVERVVILRSPLENGNEETIAELRGLLAEVLPRRQFPVIDYDPLLACHLGPQALGVVVYEGM